MSKTYAELSKFKTFEERFSYLVSDGRVGEPIFGGSRFLNQKFYQSVEWKQLRDAIIVRDGGCDLGIADRPICDHIVIHHMVPLRKDDFLYRTDFLLNPEYLICVSTRTHNAIHYGSEKTLPKEYTPRTPNDTCPWR